MKVLLAYAPGELRVVEMEKPVPGPREVLCKVAHCGVCATDIAIKKGVLNLGDGNDPVYPVRLGHEWSGRVVETGSECWQVKPGLSLSAMREAAAFLEGTHDFAAFQSAGGEEKETTVRTIFEIAVEELPEERIDIAVTGDGFLYNMVRILVGTLVETGYGKRDPADMPALLESKDRDRAGQTAPARGLYLKKVYFPGEMGYTVEEA